MGRPSNTAERREQIVAALLVVMAQHGYEHATIAKIAKAAHMRPGLVHYHFESKLEILTTLVTSITETLERRYQARILACSKDPLARLFAFVDAHVALGNDASHSAVAAWVAIAAEAVHTEEVRQLYRQALQRRMHELTQLFRRVQRQRGDSGHGARYRAAAIVSAIEGAFQIAGAAPGVLPRGFAAQSIRKMIVGLLAAPADNRVRGA